MAEGGSQLAQGHCSAYTPNLSVLYRNPLDWQGVVTDIAGPERQPTTAAAPTPRHRGQVSHWASRSPTGRAGGEEEEEEEEGVGRDAREDGESRTAATLVAPRHWGCCRHEPRRRPRPSAATPKRAQRPRVGAPATMARTTGARTEASTRSPKTEASPGPSKTEARTEPSLTGRLSSLRSQRTFCPRAFGPSFGGEVGVSTSSRALARLKCPRGAVDGAPYIVGLYKSSRELEPCRSAYRAELPPSRCP
ncbi:unnamed protein product [Prorocentrum cordatum]|uniref:Uncharacterized protein n=1 Tax=Prorocentrum cordatum TaxID=2364126 RepID=A0ABN9RL65_9DINO|nr:unnamed protein product [Polarella glacialis]